MNIFENLNSTLYRVAPVSAVDDIDDYATLMNEVTMRGGVITSIDDDTFTIKCTNKAALQDIADLLDDDYRVDEYDIGVYTQIKNGVTFKVDTDTIDIDRISDFGSDIEVIVFMKSEYIDYDSYSDIEDDELTERYVNTNTKQPLWLALSATKSSVKNGSFIVTPHPVRHDALMVHAEYKYDPSEISFIEDNVKNIKNDINTINNGMINSKLLSADYTLDDNIGFDFDLDMCKDGHFITPPAVYVKNKGNVNIPEIMESFEGSTIVAEVGIINEVKRVLKVDFKGRKRIKLKCLPGYKYDIYRKACVKITGREKADDRRAKIKMARTKKSMGSGFTRAVARKTKKAMRFRKLMGK